MVMEGRALYLKCSDECTNLPTIKLCVIKLDTHIQINTSKKEETGISGWYQCQYPESNWQPFALWYDAHPTDPRWSGQEHEILLGVFWGFFN